MNVEISFVILSWNSEQYINECLDSIIDKCNIENISFEIFIVDNGSTDRTKTILESYKEEHAEIQIIILDKNYGTTYPRNLALKRASGKYICVIDSDTKFLSGSLVDVFRYLDDHEKVGILAPRLILPGGEIQHSVKKFPTLLHKLEKLKKIFGGGTSRDLDFYSEFPFREETPVESAISACWFFRKELLSEIGLLDENIFYAPEDLDFCLRSWRARKDNIYYTKLTVLHNTQQISHQKPLSKIALSHFYGLFYYFKKHGVWFSTRR